DISIFGSHCAFLCVSRSNTIEGFRSSRRRKRRKHPTPIKKTSSPDGGDIDQVAPHAVLAGSCLMA
ncbi:hypothetical protein ACFL6S_35425, partial [Candidatus Poribacteria bacterium]